MDVSKRMGASKKEYAKSNHQFIVLVSVASSFAYKQRGTKQNEMQSGGGGGG